MMSSDSRLRLRRRKSYDYMTWSYCYFSGEKSGRALLCYMIAGGTYDEKTGSEISD